MYLLTKLKNFDSMLPICSVSCFPLSFYVSLPSATSLFFSSGFLPAQASGIAQTHCVCHLSAGFVCGLVSISFYPWIFCQVRMFVE